MSDVGWEEVCLEEGLTLVERLRVPRGWLYRTIFLGGAGAVCFVPDLGALDAVLKLEAAEKERDAARSELAVLKIERDKWIHDHGLMFVEIEVLKARIATLEATNE